MPENHISLRDATLEDLPLLMRWAGQPHVQEGVPVDQWDFEADLREKSKWRFPMIVELAGFSRTTRPIGFVQLLDAVNEETHYWGNVDAGAWAIDIWIGEPDCIGKGLGSRAMQAAIDRCFEKHGAKSILIDPLASNIRAHRFYERLGFVFHERRDFDGDDCMVYRLLR